MLPRFCSVRDVPGLLGGVPLYRCGHHARDDHCRPVLWRSWAGLDSVSDPGLLSGGDEHRQQRNAGRGPALVHTSITTSHHPLTANPQSHLRSEWCWPTSAAATWTGGCCPYVESRWSSSSCSVFTSYPSLQSTSPAGLTSSRQSRPWSVSGGEKTRWSSSKKYSQTWTSSIWVWRGPGGNIWTPEWPGLSSAPSASCSSSRWADKSGLPGLGSVLIFPGHGIQHDHRLLSPLLPTVRALPGGPSGRHTGHHHPPQRRHRSRHCQDLQEENSPGHFRPRHRPQSRHPGPLLLLQAVLRALRLDLGPAPLHHRHHLHLHDWLRCHCLDSHGGNPANKGIKVKWDFITEQMANLIKNLIFKQKRNRPS